MDRGARRTPVLVDGEAKVVKEESRIPQRPRQRQVWGPMTPLLTLNQTRVRGGPLPTGLL